jgi:ABC-type multidrug transport system fused ATPase/permease subunit
LFIYENDQIALNKDFLIDHGGENLSNGEKQIINFLRILLKNSNIVCLDEATSNVDPFTGIYNINLIQID